MVKEVDYISNMKLSFRLLISNKILFIPDLLFYLFTFGVGYYFLHFNNLIPSFNVDPNFLLERIKEIIKSSPNLIKLVYSATIFILLSIIFGIGTSSFRKIMIATLVKNKNIKLWDCYKQSRKFWFRLFATKFIITLLYLLTFFLFFILGIIIVKFKSYLPILWVFILFLLFILLILLIIYLSLILLFVDPIIFLENKRVFSSINLSINYFKNNKKNTLITFLLILAISMASGVIIFSFNLFDVLSKSFLDGLVLFIVTFVIDLLRRLITITVNLFNELFLFKNY